MVGKGKGFLAGPVFAFFVLLLLGTALEALASTGPTEQLQNGIDSIVVMFSDEVLSKVENRSERRRRIFAVVEDRFDFKRMSMLALARHWKKQSAAEQDRFIYLFSRLIMQRYIGRIEAYDDEKVVYNKEKIKGDKARVYTEIIKPGQKLPVAYIYSLKKTGDDWLVYDVIVDGVSLVKNYRSEFDSILARGDFSVLLKKIEDKTHAMEKSTAEPKK